MAHDFEHIDEGLLIKHILGETSTEENQRVQQWTAVSEENMQQYMELKEVWEAAKRTPLEVDTSAAWQKVSLRIAAEESITGKPVVRRLKRPVWGWQAAAAVVTLVGMFSLFQYLMQDNMVQLASADEKLEKTLEDGSQVTLNENSVLKYPESFETTVREVELKGEAFFDVAKMRQKPFVIRTKKASITVLGTSFNVASNPNADTRVYVESGRVKLESRAVEDSSYVVLEPGMTGVVNKAGKVFIEEAGSSDALFWVDNRLSFEKTPLPEVLKVLERSYKIRFTSLDSRLEKCLLTARFREDSVQNILSVIEATFNVHFKINGEKIQVTAENQNCEGQL